LLTPTSNPTSGWAVYFDPIAERREIGFLLFSIHDNWLGRCCAHGRIVISFDHFDRTTEAISAQISEPVLFGQDARLSFLTPRDAAMKKATCEGGLDLVTGRGYQAASDCLRRRLTISPSIVNPTKLADPGSGTAVNNEISLPLPAR
jgi:hypothetical protein